MSLIMNGLVFNHAQTACDFATAAMRARDDEIQSLTAKLEAARIASDGWRVECEEQAAQIETLRQELISEKANFK